MAGVRHRDVADPDEGPARMRTGVAVDRRDGAVPHPCHLVDQGVVRRGRGDRAECGDRPLDLVVAERRISLGDDREPVVGGEGVDGGGLRRCRTSCGQTARDQQRWKVTLHLHAGSTRPAGQAARIITRDDVDQERRWIRPGGPTTPCRYRCPAAAPRTVPASAGSRSCGRGSARARCPHPRRARRWRPAAGPAPARGAGA